MQLVILIVFMIVIGLLVGWLAGAIWQDRRPIGVRGDYAVSVATTIVVGLLDWYVIPAMGFSENLRNLGVAIEPPLAALLVLWIIRVARK